MLLAIPIEETLRRDGRVGNDRPPLHDGSREDHARPSAKGEGQKLLVFGRAAMATSEGTEMTDPLRVLQVSIDAISEDLERCSPRPARSTEDTTNNKSET
jgi:hypothetical protein